MNKENKNENIKDTEVNNKLNSVDNKENNDTIVGDTSDNNKNSVVDNSNTKVKLSKKDNIIQAIKFVGFSISAGVIQILSFTLLNELIKWSYWPSYLISLILSVLWNFTLNRQYTFKSANNVALAMIEVGLYYVVFTPLSTIGGNALANIGWNEYLILFLTMVLNMTTEFLFCRFVVYRNSINTKKKDK